MVIRKSPSGALSPYYYKGGYFHGIHYGSYFNDMDALRDMIKQEETFILKSPEKRRILIDLYETSLTPDMIDEFASHIDRLNSRIIKLAITCEKQQLKAIKKRLLALNSFGKKQFFFGSDMEEGKTWLVSDEY